MNMVGFDSISNLEPEPSRKQINGAIAGLRSIPYEKYFGEMELSEEEKQARIALAGEIELMMIFVLAYVAGMGSDAGNYKDNIVEIFQTRYAGIIAKYLVPDNYTEIYIKKTTLEIVNTTLAHVGEGRDAGNNPAENGGENSEAYFLSDDRAKFIAENEANSMLNYGDFKTAIFAGYTKKQWRTKEDTRVRETHASLNKVVIDINDLFEVGNSLMLFPRDISHGAGAKEIVGCRCPLKYIK